jgi:oligoendopeptidase F
MIQIQPWRRNANMNRQSATQSETQSTTVAELGDLPRWDLSDLYAGPECEALQSDLKDARDRARALSESHAGKVASLDGAALGQLIADYEAVQEILGRLTSYAYLRYCTNMEDSETARFFQNLSEAATDISSDLLFLTLELNRIDDDDLTARLAAAPLAHYRPWLRDVRAYRPHQLSDDLERLLHEKQVSGRSSWMRLFDETVAALRFPVSGEELTSAEVLNLLSDPDEGRRRAAAKSIGKVFGQNIRTFSLITNTLAKDKETEDKWRKFDRPISERNLSNHVEDEVVDALVEAVKQSYPRLSHRYYDLKARWLGSEKLNYWDRNAPLPEDDDRTIPWPEAVELVLSAYHAFSPQLADVGRQFFDNAWIDVPVEPGKAPGAFAHPTVPSAHPYLLLNYQGKTRDVMTLAHELGHGVHQVLAGPQGALMADTPLTLAETASVFGEQLTFRALLKAEASPSRRRVMLAGKVEDMLNTVVRQVAFCEFERQVHEQRRAGELTPERLGEIWLSIQAESLGPALHFDDEYRHFWAYIPHFIHSPFYVYAYAFGDCLVNALYAVYQDAGDGFEEKYLAMLSAGGTLRHKELLAPFGLDAGKPDFWSRGLDIVSGFVDQLEAEL